MSRMYISGHGMEVPNTKIFVPPDTSVSFYTLRGEDLANTLSLSVLLDGGRAQSQQSYTAEVEMPNYLITAEDDFFVAQYVQMGGDIGDAVWVNEVTEGSLCTYDPNDPQPGETGCAKGERHTCGGYLGAYHGHDIVFLVCRGMLMAKDSETVDQLPGHGTTVLEDQVLEADRLAGWAKQDVASAEAAADLLTPEQVAAYYSSQEFRTWMAARWAVSYVANGDFASLANHLATQTEEDFGALTGWLQSVPSYGQAFDGAAQQRPVELGAALNTLPAGKSNYFFFTRQGTAAPLKATS